MPTAVSFYRDVLGFTVVMQSAPGDDFDREKGVAVKPPVVTSYGMRFGISRPGAGTRR